MPSFFICAALHADTVMLKNGKELKGLVVERHPDRIILSTERGETPILLSGIRDVKYDDPEQSFFQIGKVYESEGKWGEALAYYQKAIELNPNFEDAEKAALGVRNHFWAVSAQGPMDEIEKKQALYDGWGPGKSSDDLIVNQMLEQAKALKEGLGFTLEDSGYWTSVANLTSKKPAEEAGIRRGDLLVFFNGESLRYLGANVVSRKLLAAPRFSSFTLEIERELKLEKSGKKLKNLGLQLEMGHQGLTVKSVAAESAAARAGLRSGDLIVRIGERATRYLPLREAVKLIENSNDAGVVLAVHRNVLLARR